MKACFLLILLTGCAVQPSGDFCDIYQPVYTHSSDTEGTKAQVDANNAVWMSLCDER